MRTTRCLFALGFSVSLVAACGDDDSTITPTGGTGGRAGSGGTAGRGGGGAAGTAGAAGRGGTAGAAGTAGAGGSTAGTGGGAGTAGGGTGGVVEPPDGGADAATDAGEVLDGGAQPIACPDDLEAASEDADSSEGTQQVIITRLVFAGTEIEVTFRAIVDFDFAAPLQLCTGSEDTDCDADVQDVDGTGAAGILTAGEEVTYSTPLGDIVTPASGEIALVNGLPSDDPAPIIRAYLNWGDYTSLAPTEGDNDDLEAAAVAEAGGLWTDGDSIEVDGQTTIYATDDVTGADGFEVCTQEAP